MAFNKRTWKGRQGTGLNKFSIDGATPVTVINQPDSVTEQGDALSAGNLNDLEDRIDNAFEEIADGTQVVGKATADASGNVITDTYETKADASELKSAIDRNSNRISNLEQEHGGYVTVNYRGDNAVPTGKAKYALVESIVGKSRAWNQLCPKFTTRTQVVGDVTWTIDADGFVRATWSTTLSENSTFVIFSSSYTWGASIAGGHYVLAGMKPTGTSTQIRYAFYDSNETSLLDSGVTDAESARIFSMPSGNTATKFYYALRIVSGTPAGSAVFYPIFRDLSVIFPDLPSTDLVTSNIPNLVKLCPDLLKPDAFGQRIVDTTVEGFKSVGVSVWNEIVEDGAINVNTGEKITSANHSRSADFFPVKPSTLYYASADYAGDIVALFYDIGKNLIKNVSGNNNFIVTGGGTFTTPSNAYFMMFYTSKNHLGGISFYQSNSSYDGQYIPYTVNTLLLPSSVTPRSAGSVADTDELNVEVNGVAKRRQMSKVGSYTFTGNETWTASGNGNCYFCTALNGLAKGISSDTQIANIMMATLVTESYSRLYYATALTGIAISNADGRLCISASDYASKATLIDGKTLNYELAEKPVTLLDPIENNMIQTEGGGTINTIQTQTPVIDNCLDVGYLAL